MNLSTSFTGWLQRTVTWHTNFNNSECIDLSVYCGNTNESAQSLTNHTLLLPIAHTCNGAVRVMANGTFIREEQFHIDTYCKLFTALYIVTADNLSSHGYG